MSRRVSPALAAMLAASATPALLGAQARYFRHHEPFPTEAAITPGDLATRLYVFAADSMLGREAGTLGNVKGTDYIAAAATRIGLIPASDSGTYFQTVPYKTRTSDTLSVIAVGSVKLALGSEWIPSSGKPAKLSASAVYGGQLGDTEHMISPAQARGKSALMSVGESPDFRAMRSASVPGAAALAIVALGGNGPGGGKGPGPASSLLRLRGFVDDPDALRPPGASNATPAPTRQISEEAAAKMFSKPLPQLRVGASGRRVSWGRATSRTIRRYPRTQSWRSSTRT